MTNNVPHKLSVVQRFSQKILKPSAANRNTKGESMSPRRRPISILHSLVRPPSMSTEIVIVIMHSLIQILHFVRKDSLLSITECKNSQSTKLLAFS
ncbi:hypothetical protein QL285_013245 [Trifolium repens]|nr:hypothetical protein QL285_013245 [Trifolium repens]